MKTARTNRANVGAYVADIHQFIAVGSHVQGGHGVYVADSTHFIAVGSHVQGGRDESRPYPQPSLFR